MSEQSFGGGKGRAENAHSIAKKGGKGGEGGSIKGGKKKKKKKAGVRFLQGEK